MYPTIPRWAVIASVLWLVAGAVRGGEPGNPKPEKQTVDETVSPRDRTPTAADREKAFAELLTGAVLEGTWQVTGPGGFAARAPLSESKREKYTIVSASKGVGDHWVISARIQFGDTDVTVPVPVRVVWSADTPMITIDDLPLPMIGTYSARVIFHKGFYSGVWYSNLKDYGGVLSGRVTKSGSSTDATPKPTQN